MTIALYATESLSLEPIAARLAAEGLDVRAIDTDEIRSINVFGPEITKAVLIVPKHGAGAQTAWFRRMLGDNRSLTLCTVQPEDQGYRKLRSVGATTVITPRSWSPEHVAERILGQMIVDGDIKPPACGKLYGATQVMRNAYKEISIIAPLSDPVLITGESGTGKELVAREIHNQSQRRSDKFVEINCGALNKELINSDLFGHAKGSYTGADHTRPGLFSEAGEGTVFLDEIGELDLKAQAVLLRVLEEKKVRRVGSNQTEAVPARVVLATNRDLEFECEAGRFREDLFERIRGFTIELAPLRYRRADIPLLAQVFLDEFNADKKPPISIAPGTIEGLFNYDWPGNVRELRSAIRNAAAFADANGFMSALRLMQATQRRRSTRSAGRGSSGVSAKHYLSFDPRVDTWKKFSERAHVAYFQTVLEVAGGNKKEAQRLSGLGSSQFYENLKTLSKLVEDNDDDNEEV
jgi:DNA-binding NtrC family response regulator